MPATSNLDVSESLVPGSDISRQLLVLGTVMSGVAYGIVVVLSLHCFHLVWRKTFRLRNFTLSYIVVMFVVSSLSFVLGIVAMTMTIFVSIEKQGYWSFGRETLLFPLALWGADGFMIYRCVVLYDGVSSRYRIALRCLLALLSLLLFGTGIVFTLSLFAFPTSVFAVFPHYPLAAPSVSFIVLASITTFINMTLATLVIVRLYRHQRRTRKLLGTEYNGSPYSRVIAICIESCALIVVVDVVYIVLWASDQQSYASTIPEQLLVHVSVISPLLLISRISRGKDVLSTIKSQRDLQNRLEAGGRLETLRFRQTSEQGTEFTGQNLPEDAATCTSRTLLHEPSS